jgi:glycosyltransferase 2 family protein
LLMAAAAVAIALITGVRNHGWIQLICLAVVLTAIHPRFLNPLLQLASRLKKASTDETAPPQIRRYPWRPLLGEVGFVTLRSLGFVCTLSALTAIAPAQIPLLISAFSLAWVLGLVIPGAPGGVGIFEATAIALLGGQFPTGIILGGVALYRLVSILAEVVGAGFASVKTR